MNIKSLTIKSTVILELEVMTELTEDEFYDNGNIAENIAALLGINPKKIKIMDVVRLVNFFQSGPKSGWSEGAEVKDRKSERTLESIFLFMFQYVFST